MQCSECVSCSCISLCIDLEFKLSQLVFFKLPEPDRSPIKGFFLIIFKTLLSHFIIKTKLDPIVSWSLLNIKQLSPILSNSKLHFRLLFNRYLLPILQHLLSFSLGMLQ